MTREPGLTDATLTKWLCLFTTWTLVRGTNATNVNDFWQGNKVTASRVVIERAATLVAGTHNVIGNFRGMVKANFLIFLSGGTVNIGDTIVINGTTYVVVGPASTFLANRHLIVPES